MRLGIIGCGTVAQTMHVPHAVELPETELLALSDPAADRVETLADRYGVPGRYAAVEELLADAAALELDAVVVCTPMQHHAEVVEATLEAGLHTLVEKPLAAAPADADRMVAAAAESDATAMVGYMKRYAPAYERASEVLADLDPIDLVTAYDVDPDHERILGEVYDLVGGAPPEALLAESAQKRQADAMAAIGAEDPDLAADYSWHLEHVCHDVNLLRGLFGDVVAIDHVDLFADGRYASARLRYEGDLRCRLDSGDSERREFEQFVRVDGPDAAVTLEYDNPFVKNSPASLRVRRGTEELSDETYRGSYEEPFKRELRRFVACARGERPVRTTVAEARDDVRLIADLFRTLAGTERLGDYADAHS
jgi:predicted dehydrogenase